VVARFGENGFGIILPFAGQNVSVVHDRLSNKTLGWSPARGLGHSIQIRFGDSYAPKDGKTYNSLVSAALASMKSLVR
jgi:hypothetical protein